MSEQLSMFADDPPPAARVAAAAVERKPGAHSLFFALVPSAEEAELLARRGDALAGEQGVGGTLLEPGRLHVSLFALDGYVDVFPRQQVDVMLRAAAKVRRPTFNVTFDRALSFKGRDQETPFVLKAASHDSIAELHAFRRALGFVLADAGLALKDAKVTPHMTLAYGALVPEVAIEPIRWRAREFVLIDSHVGKHLHEVLGRWSLGG